MNIESYVGVAAGICTSVSLLPQLIKIIREKKADNISWVMLFILIGGLGLWVWYGIIKNDLPIIITNSFSLLVNFLIIYFTYRYKSSNN